VAELASSMLWAAPLAALLAVPAYGLLGVELTRQPEQMAYLFGLTLLGTWGVLVPNKLWEGRTVDTTTRRLGYLAIGLVVGAIGLLLGNWTQLNLQSGMRVQFDSPASAFRPYAGSLAHPNLLGYMTYFGILFGLNGWWKMTARGRGSRFRLSPVFKSGLVALALGLLWPFPQPWGVMIAVLVAMVTQLVSPWSESAAVYHRATGRSAA
jgi:hypothetical protein